ncbi:hypothetical protein PsorP6_000477 [Peronosclerospora sorghi]|uniref:Uncharacterized protein n=1 Tax=Peronosclerospora sorghi TaxID=230839 RepID=A0ACC0WSK0_9STRA|nr:hypothetical protein PsorP6_000477 [Peronosclerospora sorghi]
MTHLKAPKSPGTLEVTKGNLKKQEENAQDLVVPVDMTIQVDLFFRHFLKEKPRFFKKRVPGVVDGAGAVDIKNERRDDPVENENEGHPFTYNEDSVGFEGGFDEDEEDGSSGLDDPGTQSLYSIEGLVQADRVVEKIGVHYERFAKLEVNDCGKRARESETDGVDAVPSNVTVSFYFICILHLANEKGLKLVGQTDLRNFEILKEGV